MTESKCTLEACLNMTELPSAKLLSSLTEKVCAVLKNEEEAYRPHNCVGEAGSLLNLSEDFSHPTVIVPDIHARPDFVKNFLNCPLPADFLEGPVPEQSVTVLEALKKKLINVVCVGDAVHTELYGARWSLIAEEFKKGEHQGFFMTEEMILNFATLCSLMKLKIRFPQNFHFLKGNHENILNCNYGGDYAFYKYADEGEMVRTFVTEYYGEKILEQIARYENLLPLAAYGKNYVVSHAEPAGSYKREQLIDAKFDEEVVEGLIWTRNGVVNKPTAMNIMVNLLGKRQAKKSLYFAGHRPVKGLFNFRQDGTFLQIHNPHNQNIFLVRQDKPFAVTDILNTKISLIKNQEEQKDEQ